MDYLEKVRLLVNLKEKQTYEDREKPDFIYIDIYPEESKWQPGELVDLLKNYPYAPEAYKVFIEEFDSISLLFVDFFGSKNNSLSIVQEIADYYQPIVPDYFPFAKDPAGGVFAIYKDGSVVFFLDDDYEFEKPEKVADDFVDFIDNYILGKKADPGNDPKFYEFIASLGWR